MKDFEPKVHIAWRHNVKITHAPTYLWSHDLACMGMEKHENYDGVLVLSEFHKNFVRGMFPGIPESKIIVFRNGVESHKFFDAPKNPNKIVYTSSPDRGLDNAILVMDEARKTNPSLELHCAYSFDNMIKMGKTEEANRMMQMINERPWVTMHGNLKHDKLAELLSDAVVWLYPTHFNETFCITALEMICAKVYPLYHGIGALPDTLKEYTKNHMADEIGFPFNEETKEAWAKSLLDVIDSHKWESIIPDKESMTWNSVAKDACEIFKIKLT
jgi:glycosyltransferase involved in cell wall biosynthesis